MSVAVDLCHKYILYLYLYLYLYLGTRGSFGVVVTVIAVRVRLLALCSLWLLGCWWGASMTWHSKGGWLRAVWGGSARAQVHASR